MYLKKRLRPIRDEGTGSAYELLELQRMIHHNRTRVSWRGGGRHFRLEAAGL